VEDPSGKGYVITVGTYVGSNFGRVTRILKDRIIVEEEVEDFFTGKMKLQPVELRLQKKFGEV
jgi:type IV pilus assembly protein PilP